MTARNTRPRRGLLLVSIVAILCGCAKHNDRGFQDSPQLVPGVKLQDVKFHSDALNREMQYRVILPETIASDEKLPVVYLLHGGGGGFRDWSNYSDVAKYTQKGLILVMPEGNSSYYTNSATVTADRYEDYIVKDLIADVEARFPGGPSTDKRAIAGVSMGGYGAIKIALRYPQLFTFAGGVSPAVDVPTRPFSMKRVAQWRFHSSIFGPSGSQTRRENDPYALAQAADPKEASYLLITCGEQEGLLPANRKLAALLKERGFRYEFVALPGDHNWEQWDKQIPRLFDRILARFGTQIKKTSSVKPLLSETKRGAELIGPIFVFGR